MKNNTPFKVGDKIIDFGQVYRIFKTEKKKSAEGKKEKVICFKPYFRTQENESLICSISEKNISLAHIRRPISKKELRQLLKELSKKPEIKKPINTREAKDTLNRNDPQKTAQILNEIWLDKDDESTSSTQAKRDIFELSIKRLVEEVAFVGNTSVAKARKRIRKALEKLKNDG